MASGQDLFPLALPTLIANLRVWTSRIDAGFVTCEGRRPLFVTGGTVVIGRRLALRSRQAPVELGARRGGSLIVGDNVFINSGATVVANVLIKIGHSTKIGDFTAIFDSNYHELDQVTPMKTLPVHIGTNVWIGRGAVVLPGVKIGDHAVVAANSVVSKDVPSRVLVAGAPAQVVRTLVADARWRRG